MNRAKRVSRAFKEKWRPSYVIDKHAQALQRLGLPRKTAVRMAQSAYMKGAAGG